jgi:hypothetical protein
MDKQEFQNPKLIEFAQKENDAIDVIKVAIEENQINLKELEEREKFLNIEIPIIREKINTLTKSLQILEEKEGER